METVDPTGMFVVEGIGEAKERRKTCHPFAL
jgi:hypothetical protein